MTPESVRPDLTPNARDMKSLPVLAAFVNLGLIRANERMSERLTFWVKNGNIQ